MKTANKLFRNDVDNRHYNWYSEKDKTWYYASLYKEQWDVGITKPEYGDYAEFGYYKGFGVSVDNEGTFLTVGDEVAVAYKSGRTQKSVRRGVITKLAKEYAYVSVLGEENCGPQKFAPQSLLKLSGNKSKTETENKNVERNWFCKQFPHCSLDCKDCNFKIKIDYKKLDRDIKAEVKANVAKYMGKLNNEN